MLFGANDDLLQRIINKHEMSLILFSCQSIECKRQLGWNDKKVFEASVIIGKFWNIISWLKLDATTENYNCLSGIHMKYHQDIRDISIGDKY